MQATHWYQTLPSRLRRAVWIWLGIAPIVALFPGAGMELVGVLAHPAFWCGWLPLIALAPYLRKLLPVMKVRRLRRKPAEQARRRRQTRLNQQLAA